MGRIWEDQNKYQRWLDVELAVVESLADQGIIPRKDAEEIRSRANFSVERINVIEAEVKHDVIAFTTSVAEFVGPASRFFHFGLTSSDVLILESNHDLEMLRVGPYPWTLKQRLIGRYGHLSNTAVGRFIRDQYDGHAQHVVLAHLSTKNNHPAIARHETATALRHRGLANTQLTVTSQDEPTVPIRL